MDNHGWIKIWDYFWIPQIFRWKKVDFQMEDASQTDIRIFVHEYFEFEDEKFSL